MSSGGIDSEQNGEQQYLTRLYERLDQLREETRSRLDEVLLRTGPGHQGLAERDVAASELAQRLARLDAVENGLCFGRLDLRDGERRHIGRIGIQDELAAAGTTVTDEESGGRPLLMDWRAPAARPFYTATAISPENVRRRRHISSSGRKVTAVKDEEFDDLAEISGDSALLEALTAARTGRMTDIVATIQAEQDEIIRSRHTGVLVVQGGPGTGKTAVALHRTAYLLYTQRERLARSVVLIVGPNPTFLRYIGEVLPSLGETGVLLATVEELYPGVRADRPESPEAAEVKGRLAMAEVVAAAVRDRQRVPEEPIAVDHDGETLTLDPDDVARARRLARESLLPHNEARPLFRRLIIDALARRVADRYGTDVLDGGSLLDEEDIEDFRRELRASPEVAAVVERLWPALAPQRLLAELYASPARLAAAAPGLTEAERAALLRPPAGGRGWTAANVPLLDEAAELLGTDERRARLAAEAEAAERGERLTLAQEALDIAYGSRTTDFDDGADPELLSAYDLLDAEQLAERHREADHRTPVERAAADRTWAFGHVVVDEAQELSPMAWRLLMRRCPARSMTVVGDIAQASGVAATRSWEAVLAPHVGARWRLAELTVNYRLPSEIAEVAAEVLRRIDPGLRAPGAVRSSGVTPWRRSVPEDGLAVEAAELAARAAAEAPGGRVGVVAPASRLAEVASAVAGTALAERSEMGVPPAEGWGKVDVLDPGTAKGLEFDAVIVVDPGRIVADSPRGLNDLYVALTRPTQRLGVLHPGGPPALLRRLRRLV
ncbi:HelD family protein [Streptomyces sp. 6N223]|uniref:HelD family protein n=1 Tax=Streptomyces sp. 6N223 TaxID=3457412 RepID=UPI003FCEF247